MSQENVDIARRGFEAFNRTFREGTPDFYETLDPNVEWVPMSALLEGTGHHGHDGVRQWFEDMKRDWTTYELRPERFLDMDDNRVLTLGAWRAQGRGGDVLLDFLSTTYSAAADAAGWDRKALECAIGVPRQVRRL